MLLIPSVPLLMLAMNDLPRLTTQTAIGITVAISGNILISLALNLQKLAHKRLDQLGKHATTSNPPSQNPPEHTAPGSGALEERGVSETTPGDAEMRPLLHIHTPPSTNYAACGPGVNPPSQNGLMHLSRLRKKHGAKLVAAPLVEAGYGNETLHAPEALQKHLDSKVDETEYLKSKLWWLGFILMNIGELGNFMAYAFAPASVVAPLGTFALIANCFIAPVMLGEHFRTRDFFGVCVAVVGAITVVLSTNASNARLDPRQLLKAITQMPFLIYVTICISGAIILAILSHSKAGRTYVFIDVGLCALFGGFTVLSTKALSTLITLEWYEIFTEWITYPLLVTLVGTGVGQIRYLNRALICFDSKAVIPVQFVLFTLAAITGSAILYGDFRKASFHELVTFVYGCAATFAGVFILARSSDNQSEHSSHAVQDGNTTIVRPVDKRQRAIVLTSDLENGQETPLRNKKITIPVVGISPAQHLLLVHTPTREFPSWSRESENECEDSDRIPTTRPCGRKRSLDDFGNIGALSGSPRSQSSTLRENNMTGRSTATPSSGSPSVGKIGGSQLT